MSACSTLLCDNCKLPGRCCTGFDLNFRPLNKCQTALEVLVFLATIVTSENAVARLQSEKKSTRGNSHLPQTQIGLPFMPLYKRKVEGIDGGGVWRFWCPNLDISTGRCGDYENRPGLCRLYRAGSDPLCAMWAPPTKSDGADTIKKNTL